MVLALLGPAVAGAWDCTGKPKTYGDVREQWLSVDRASRPQLGLRWANWTESGEGDGAPIVPPDDVYVSLQINKLIAISTGGSQ